MRAIRARQGFILLFFVMWFLFNLEILELLWVLLGIVCVLCGYIVESSHFLKGNFGLLSSSFRVKCWSNGKKTNLVRKLSIEFSLDSIKI